MLVDVLYIFWIAYELSILCIVILLIKESIGSLELCQVFKFENEAEAVKGLSQQQPVLQPFLEEQDKFAFNIPRKRFLVALHAYYASKGVPLLSSERDEIVRYFTNPGTGDMNIRRVEAFVRMHEKPCRKHGRMICGACSYFRECSIDDCECALYK